MVFTSLFISILIKAIALYSHPVHVSVTNIDYSSDSNRMEISFKAFSKDMQLLFVHLNQINIDFENIEQLNNNMERVDKYFVNNFKIGNGAGFEMSLKKMEPDKEWVWFYYEVELDELIEEIEIRNTILLDLFFDQKNMLIFSIGDKEKGYMFNREKTSHRIDLNDF